MLLPGYRFALKKVGKEIRKRSFLMLNSLERGKMKKKRRGGFAYSGLV